MGYVPRALLAPCVTCPLCDGYFREASAFSECGHTFCRECIMKKIDEEEIEACPVCDVALGITPEEKLRADISIQAIRNNLFPPKAEVDASEAPTIKLPAKRKERSISSLVETPKMATQSTLTGRRTKAARRRMVVARTAPGPPVPGDGDRPMRSWAAIGGGSDGAHTIVSAAVAGAIAAFAECRAKEQQESREAVERLVRLEQAVAVEILCHDKPVCPSTTLHGLLKRWLSCKPKDEVQRPVGAPANEFVMELRYRRCSAR